MTTAVIYGNAILGLIAILSVLSAVLQHLWVSRPVLRLARAADDIAHGKFDRIRLTERNDEIGDLSRHFRKMRDSINRLLKFSA